jgi:ABC-type glutathione transport system ATPase component
MEWLKQMYETQTFSFIFISHDPVLISRLCSEVIVLDKGQIIEYGLISDIFNHPTNDKTKKLLSGIGFGQHLSQ